ncbi:type III secretion system stator protein SctL [Methylobacterium sp. ARG-1]|uniref:type III secretion system stator protein SctL n=1 Tax=Methylobacterium sp. ARG-1 TaxID=1692501 RepID=UPI0006815944|nr:type III secretion system stator protein SctL [Methylobacterium sp. ARG-1]KNY19780.1 hypothetical protein AKJ13_25540 [Methylobacterium sp. ARG-1]
MPDQAPAAPRLRPTGPIVPAAETGIWNEARAGLAAAHRHVVETREWAQAHLERERARGYAEGREAGAEAAARLLADTAARAADHVAALEQDLPALVHDLVTEIVGTFEPGDRIGRAVRKAVAKLQPEAEAVLRVCPGEIEAVRGALAGLGDRAPQIEADPSLGPGESTLRSPIGSVEIGIAAQLRALRAGLAALEPHP